MTRNDLMMYAKMAQRGVGYIAGQVEVTSKCYQKCAYCESFREETNLQMSLSNMLRLCDSLSSNPCFETLTLTGGDPQAWNHFNSFLEHINGRNGSYDFFFKINTAMMGKIRNPKLWQIFKEVRVSLDAATQLTYKATRGVSIDPAYIIDKLENLNLETVSFMITVSPLNILEIGEIHDLINNSNLNVRKICMLPVMTNEPYSNSFEMKLRRLFRNSQENPLAIRDFLLTKKAKEIDCYVGAISFHIKPNGDVYPCCLVGGEAIKTDSFYKIGNINERTINQIQKGYYPNSNYRAHELCCKVCQFKQCEINRLATEAEATYLSMP